MDKPHSKHFFISYNKADRDRAEWIAWQLEKEGYRTVIQAWDFPASSNFIREMQKGLAEAERVLGVLSPDALKAPYVQAEWSVALADDPLGEKRRLVLVRVRECQPEGLVKPIVYIDLVGRGEENAARDYLLARIRQIVTGERSMPSESPPYLSAMPPPEQADPTGTPGVPSAGRGDARAAAGGATSAAPAVASQTDETRELIEFIAMLLDRTPQWKQLTRECAGSRSVVFLLSGPEDQYLEFFTLRVQRFLGSKGDHQHVLVVPRIRWEAVCTVGVEELKDQLQVALAKVLGRSSGTLAELFRKATERRALLIVLGHPPLRVLEPVQEKALEEFLTTTLPLLRTVALHPVRVLVAVEYQHTSESLGPIIRRWLTGAAGKKARRVKDEEGRSVRIEPLPLCPLDDVRAPSAADVERYLREHHQPRPAEPAIEGIIAAYKALVGSTEHHDFKELVAQLREYIDMEMK